ncbi:glutathione S-transferase C-terminal-like protein [Crucibulum laeve]|uniref:Glutathione S-transferase C-terminal-like protein n=1 Tax=Crucibulum laeve TaxID=68775 RepID=A0A5C3M4T2_9AGAR|nr:glutathione S-transferase C-terminal-like protein [Crucibulum laeve]
MAPAGTLWTVPVQHSGKVIKATAALGGVTIEIPTSYEHFVDNEKPEFLAKFPHGKIPAWEGADGFKLFEGVAIARYVASLAPNAGLLGHTSEEVALIGQWIHLVETEIDNYTNFTRDLCSGTIPYNKPAHTLFLERQLRAVNTVEQHLSTRTFFVGERITLADLYVAALIQKAVATTLDAAARTKLPNLVRHLETIVNQPTLKEIYGPVQYVEKGIQFTPPKKEKEAKSAAAPTPKAEVRGKGA